MNLSGLTFGIYPLSAAGKPFGIYICMLKVPWSFVKKILTIVGLTFIFEIIQFIFAIGRADITDVLSNTLAGYKTSKGAIQLPLCKLIDYELITDIVRWRVKLEVKGSDTL